MKFIKYAVYTALALAIPAKSFANPVSFKDGYGVMASTMPQWSDFEFNYSYTNRSAVGVTLFNLDRGDKQESFAFGQYNYLLKRWNELDSQANLYVIGGLGAREYEDESAPAARVGFEADYETRRFYTSIYASRLQSTGDSGGGVSLARGRVGFAPYKAPFTSLQTWLITQVDYTPELTDTTTVSPLVRFFYNNYALEVGSTLKGEPFAGVMIHF